MISQCVPVAISLGAPGEHEMGLGKHPRAAPVDSQQYQDVVMW